jgi:hypothetical protein
MYPAITGKKINPDSTHLLFRKADIGDPPISSILNLNKFEIHGQVQK